MCYYVIRFKCVSNASRSASRQHFPAQVFLALIGNKNVSKTHSRSADPSWRSQVPGDVLCFHVKRTKAQKSLHKAVLFPRKVNWREVFLPECSRHGEKFFKSDGRKALLLTSTTYHCWNVTSHSKQSLGLTITL